MSAAAHEKATWVLPTPQAAQETQHSNYTPAKQRLARLRARAAMAGVTLCVYPDEDSGETVYIVSRWNQIKQLSGIVEAEAWLTKVTGRTA